MNKATEQINWNAIEEIALGKSIESIRYAILDMQATLESADALDRADGGCRGGYYRDEISIYRRIYVKKKVQK